MNNVTQGLKPTETAWRNNLRQRVTGVNLNNHLAEARRLLQEKQEVVDALRSIIAVADASKFVSVGMGAGAIRDDYYRDTLDKTVAEVERFKNVVAILEELYNNEQGRAAT